MRSSSDSQSQAGDAHDSEESLGSAPWSAPTLLRSGTVRIVVRDGTGEHEGGGGQILREFDASKLVEVGELLILPDGGAGTVMGFDDRFNDDVGWQRTVHVRNA